jgi:CRP/FNR family transcriptional regulator, cyclic AMP receptor protein
MILLKTRVSLYDLLHQVPLFDNLCIDEMRPVVELTKMRHYQSGHHVFLQGDEFTNVYFIHSGKVKIYKTDFNGKEQIVNILQPGDMFPHSGFFRKGTCPAHAEVIEDAILVYIPMTQFEEYLILNPEICVKMFRVLGDKIVELQNRLEEQILHNTFEQIIMLLLRLAKLHGLKLENGLIRLNTTFTNRELASMIGSSRETVSRTLTQLKKKQIVQISKAGYFTIDTDLLEDQLM